MTPDPGANMPISILSTAAVALAMLLFTATFLMTGAFAGSVPAGANAAGLVVPLFASVVAGLLLLTAAWLALAGGRLSWIGVRPGTVSTLVLLGVGSGAVAVLIAWMEREGGWVAPVGLFAGCFAPLAAGALVLASLWMPPARLASASWPRVLGASLVTAALLGFVLAGLALASSARLGRENQRRASAAQAEETAERSRRDSLSPIERLREEYAGMSPKAPLWVFVAALPGARDTEARAFVIARALEVPDLDAELERTITDDHPLYRHGAIVLVREAPKERLELAWEKMLIRATAITAAEIAAQPGWLVPKPDSNPDPSGYIEALLGAADRFRPRGGKDAAFDELRAALAGLPASPERDAALARFPAR